MDYLPTWMAEVYGTGYIAQYSSSMEHLGLLFFFSKIGPVGKPHRPGDSL